MRRRNKSGGICKGRWSPRGAPWTLARRKDARRIDGKMGRDADERKLSRVRRNAGLLKHWTSAGMGIILPDVSARYRVFSGLFLDCSSLDAHAHYWWAVAVTEFHFFPFVPHYELDLMSGDERPKWAFRRAHNAAILFTDAVSLHSGQINLLATQTRIWCQSSRHTLGDRRPNFPKSSAII